MAASSVMLRLPNQYNGDRDTFFYMNVVAFISSLLLIALLSLPDNNRQQTSRPHQRPSSQYRQQQSHPEPRMSIVGTAENFKGHEQNCAEPSTETTKHQAQEKQTERLCAPSSSTSACELEGHDEEPSFQDRLRQNCLPEPSMSIVGTAENFKGNEQNCSQPSTETTQHHAWEEFTKGGCVSSSSTDACEMEGHDEKPSSQYRQGQQLSLAPEPSTCTVGCYGELRSNHTRSDTQSNPQETPEQTEERRTSGDQRKKEFYMDSGAAAHSTYDKSDLKSYPPNLEIKSRLVSISGFTGPSISVQGFGYLDGPGAKLDSVLFLPDSVAKLVSVGQLTRDHPVKVVFYRDKFWIEELQNGVRIGEGHRDGDSNHYVVDILYTPLQWPVEERGGGDAMELD